MGCVTRPMGSTKPTASGSFSEPALAYDSGLPACCSTSYRERDMLLHACSACVVLSAAGGLILHLPRRP